MKKKTPEARPVEILAKQGLPLLLVHHSQLKPNTPYLYVQVKWEDVYGDGEEYGTTHSACSIEKRIRIFEGLNGQTPVFFEQKTQSIIEGCEDEFDPKTVEAPLDADKYVPDTYHFPEDALSLLRIYTRYTHPMFNLLEEKRDILMGIHQNYLEELELIQREEEELDEN